MGRGGGSIEDLWPFNEEVVARAIYASDIPVISAVGHEPDVTISDLVADRRASTPSNAAELAVPDQAELRRKLQMLAERMCKSQQHKIDGYDRRLRELQRKRVLTDPMSFLQDRSMQLDLTQERLVSAMERVIDRNTRRFTHAAASLDAMSPLRVLRRGYCVAQKAMYAPIMMTSPCAKLSILAMPYTIVYPRAMIAYTLPRLMPLHR